MTIDSAYFPERFDADNEVKYTFTFEHIGEPAIQVFVIQSDGKTLQAEFDPDLVES